MALLSVKQGKAIAVSCGCLNDTFCHSICCGLNMCEFRFFLETELEHPRPHNPHMGQDCKLHGRPRVSMSTRGRRPRLTPKNTIDDVAFVTVHPKRSRQFSCHTQDKIIEQRAERMNHKIDFLISNARLVIMDFDTSSCVTSAHM